MRSPADTAGAACTDELHHALGKRSVGIPYTAMLLTTMIRRIPPAPQRASREGCD